jgi:hypothetical protein
VLPIVLIAATLSGVPQLNIERICHGAAANRLTDDEYKTCLDSEQTARSTLEQKWAQYPDKVRKECARVVRIAPESSYAELQTCIESQTGDRATGGDTLVK